MCRTADVVVVNFGRGMSITTREYKYAENVTTTSKNMMVLMVSSSSINVRNAVMSNGCTSSHTRNGGDPLEVRTNRNLKRDNEH